MLFFVIVVVAHLIGSVKVAMEGVLTLSVDPQSGSVTSGDSVKFTCNVTGPGPVAKLHLYKVGTGEQRVINISGKSFHGVFEFKAQTSDAATYYCVYDTVQFASVAYSNYVKLTVKGLVWPIAMGIRLGFVFIFHLVVISVWCWKPGNKEHLKIPMSNMPMTELTKSTESP
ncbi:uncharacterized protein LOC144669462 [Cetorhinus maximus]